jgi:hypothetical protein
MASGRHPRQGRDRDRRLKIPKVLACIADGQRISPLPKNSWCRSRHG